VDSIQFKVPPALGLAAETGVAIGCTVADNLVGAIEGVGGREEVGAMALAVGATGEAAVWVGVGPGVEQPDIRMATVNIMTHRPNIFFISLPTCA
jgi:hypothetical protein